MLSARLAAGIRLDWPVGRGNIESVGGIQLDFGFSKAGRLREFLFDTWWSSGNRVLIFPILADEIALILFHVLK